MGVAVEAPLWIQLMAVSLHLEQVQRADIWARIKNYSSGLRPNPYKFYGSILDLQPAAPHLGGFKGYVALADNLLVHIFFLYGSWAIVTADATGGNIRPVESCGPLHYFVNMSFPFPEGYTKTFRLLEVVTTSRRAREFGTALQNLGLVMQRRIYPRKIIIDNSNAILLAVIDGFQIPLPAAISRGETVRSRYFRGLVTVACTGQGRGACYVELCRAHYTKQVQRDAADIRDEVFKDVFEVFKDIVHITQRCKTASDLRYVILMGEILLTHENLAQDDIEYLRRGLKDLRVQEFDSLPLEKLTNHFGVRHRFQLGEIARISSGEQAHEILKTGEAMSSAIFSYEIRSADNISGWKNPYFDRKTQIVCNKIRNHVLMLAPRLFLDDRSGIHTTGAVERQARESHAIAGSHPRGTMTFPMYIFTVGKQLAEYAEFVIGEFRRLPSAALTALSSQKRAGNTAQSTIVPEQERESWSKKRTTPPQLFTASPKRVKPLQVASDGSLPASESFSFSKQRFPSSDGVGRGLPRELSVAFGISVKDSADDTPTPIKVLRSIMPTTHPNFPCFGIRIRNNDAKCHIIAIVQYAVVVLSQVGWNPIAMASAPTISRMDSLLARMIFRAQISGRQPQFAPKYSVSEVLATISSSVALAFSNKSSYQDATESFMLLSDESSLLDSLFRGTVEEHFYTEWDSAHTHEKCKSHGRSHRRTEPLGCVHVYPQDLDQSLQSIELQTVLQRQEIQHETGIRCNFCAASATKTTQVVVAQNHFTTWIHLYEFVGQDDDNSPVVVPVMKLQPRVTFHETEYHLLGGVLLVLGRKRKGVHYESFQMNPDGSIYVMDGDEEIEHFNEGSFLNFCNPEGVPTRLPVFLAFSPTRSAAGEWTWDWVCRSYIKDEFRLGLYRNQLNDSQVPKFDVMHSMGRWTTSLSDKAIRICLEGMFWDDLVNFFADIAANAADPSTAVFSSHLIPKAKEGDFSRYLKKSHNCSRWLVLYNVNLHWVLLEIFPRDSIVVTWDPLGITQPPPILAKIMGTSAMKSYSSDDFFGTSFSNIQKDSESCGPLMIATMFARVQWELPPAWLSQSSVPQLRRMLAAVALRVAGHCSLGTLPSRNTVHHFSSSLTNFQPPPNLGVIEVPTITTNPKRGGPQEKYLLYDLYGTRCSTMKPVNRPTSLIFLFPEQGYSDLPECFSFYVKSDPAYLVRRSREKCFSLQACVGVAERKRKLLTFIDDDTGFVVVDHYEQKKYGTMADTKVWFTKHAVIAFYVQKETTPDKRAIEKVETQLKNRNGRDIQVTLVHYRGFDHPETMDAYVPNKEPQWVKAMKIRK